MKKIVEFLYISLLFSPLISFKKKRKIPKRLKPKFIDVKKKRPIPHKKVVALINGGKNSNGKYHSYQRVVYFNGDVDWIGDSVYSHKSSNGLHNVVGWHYLAEYDDYKHLLNG
jgi:hypothetical protein